MADSDEGFLSRWARRKAEEAEAPEPSAEDAAGPPEAGESDGPPDSDGKTEAEREAEIVAALPDIDSLGEGSDFAQFMQKGVPAALQRRALRKLWRVNPVFSFLDGMNEYDEDFTLATSALTEVKTIYQVGKGMVLPEEETAAEAEAVEEGSEVVANDDTAGDEAVAEITSAAADDDAETPAAEPEPAALPEVASKAEMVPSNSEDPNPAPAGSGRSAARRRWGAFEV